MPASFDWSGRTGVPFHSVMMVAPRTPGVYMMRLSAEPELGPVYIGMAGERKGNGLRGRAAHINERRFQPTVRRAAARAALDASWIR